MSEPELDLETTEALERALDLVAAKRSGGQEAYHEKLLVTTAEVCADTDSSSGIPFSWETGRALHALARIGSAAIRLYASTSGVPPARAFQMVAESLTDTEVRPDEDESDEAGEASDRGENP